MSVSQMLGNRTGTPYSLMCPGNSYMTQFNANVRWWINGIGAKCSDGTSLGPAGSSAGDMRQATSQSGFGGYSKAATGDSLDSVTFIDTSGNVIQTVGGTGGSPVPEWKCPSGQKITGISGHTYTLPDGVTGITAKFHCGADSKSKTDDKKTDDGKTGEKKSYTWVYILLGFLLIIIIGIIITVVVISGKKKHMDEDE